MKRLVSLQTADWAATLTGLWQTPTILLLVTGSLIGLNFPLGKIAGEAGVSPLVWAMLISLGVTLMLFPAMLVTRSLVFPAPRVLRYTVVSALVSFVTFNLLLFTVIPHAGAGYAGLMFALSPLFTTMLAAMFKLIKTPGRIGRIGIALGMLGAALVSLTRSSNPEGPGIEWVLAALAIPIALAVGNVYRTLDWPEGTAPNVLAFWGHAFSSCVFMTILATTRDNLPLAEIAPAAGAALVQMIVSGLTFPVFFRLQVKGGPVLLSQIGYVAAAVGLISATLFLGESYSAITWLGAAVIGLGIATTIIAQRLDQGSQYGGS
ncbi:MAG: DMT family transporter [Candidatus Thiodiazotropha sp.]